MIKITQEALDTQILHLHFNEKVNYLANRDPQKLKNIANYLKGIIKKEKYIELLPA